MKYIKLIIAFSIFLNIGAFLNEKAQEKIAQQFGYESNYSSILRYYIFFHPVYAEVINSETDTLEKINITQEADHKNRRYKDLIEKFYLYSISILFLLLYKKSKIDLLLVPAFLFFKDLAYNGFYTLFQFYTCSEFNHWGTFGESQLALLLFAIIGLLFLVIILYCIPKEKRKLIIPSGIIGGLFGAYLWCFYSADYLLS